MFTRHSILLVVIGFATQCAADTIHVPREHQTIQAAIDTASSGDVVVVEPGKYLERIRLKDGVTVRSAGGNSDDESGMRRAEATMIDGGGKEGNLPGVVIAEGSTLDGFTVTNVGLYDEATWNKHHDSQGEGQPHEHIGQFGLPAIGIVGVNCTVTNCIVHHKGDTDIAIRGAKGTRCSPPCSCQHLLSQHGWWNWVDE